MNRIGSPTAGTGHCLRVCSVCGKTFMAVRPKAAYCSATCKRAVLLQRRHAAGRQRRHHRCPRCGNIFVARRVDGVYCSNACRQAMHRRRVTHEGR